MTKIKQAAERSGVSEKLIRAVLRQLGGGKYAINTLRDVNRGGADAGFAGFTWHSDTVAFFKLNRKEIVALAEQQADGMGENTAEMVASFQCLAGRRLKHDRTDAFDYRTTPHNRAILNEYMPSVARCLYGGRLTDDDTDVANALAWFALEEVARAFDGE